MNFPKLDFPSLYSVAANSSEVNAAPCYPRFGLRARQCRPRGRRSTAEVDLATAFRKLHSRCCLQYQYSSEAGTVTPDIQGTSHAHTCLPCDVSQGLNFSHLLCCWMVIIGENVSYLLIHGFRDFSPYMTQSVAVSGNIRKYVKICRTPLGRANRA